MTIIGVGQSSSATDSPVTYPTPFNAIFDRKASTIKTLAASHPLTEVA
jgi:hypothetical protein